MLDCESTGGTCHLLSARRTMFVTRTTASVLTEAMAGFFRPLTPGVTLENPELPFRRTVVPALQPHLLVVSKLKNLQGTGGKR